MKPAVLVLILVLSGTAAEAGCIDLSRTPQVHAVGSLSREIFPGRPNFEDVRKGDEPEPAYILRLDAPLCVNGDDFVGDGTSVSRIHLVDEAKVLSGFVGRAVSVTGSDAYGAHTGHHRAPLVMTAVSAAPKPVENDISIEGGKTTVKAFYLALETGDGTAAARNVTPEKRKTGNLSARQLSAFYGSLSNPLKLKAVEELSDTQYRARYQFTARSGQRCDGSSIVTISQVDDLYLISSIRSESGC